MKGRSLLVVVFVLPFSLYHEEPAHSRDAPAAPGKDQPADQFTRNVLPFLKKHCYACHGNGKKTGELTFEDYKDENAVRKNRKLWQSVQQMLRDDLMPPEEKPRPTAAEIAGVLKGIEAVLASGDRPGLPKR